MSFNLWEVSVLHLEVSTRIRGVVVDAKKQRALLLKKGIIASYFIKPAKNFRVGLKIGSEILDCLTDAHGAFEFLTDNLIGRDYDLLNRQTGEVLNSIQSYNSEFDFSNSPFHVISDIDDTILVSHSPYFFRRIATLLLKGPDKRKSIPFTHQILEYYHRKNSGIYYVSKSESNLFHNLTSFISKRTLPVGPLFLTPFTRARSLPFHQKDKNHKIKHIRWLLNHTGSKPFILIGDDGQRDMEVYATISNEFPERIERIFIHQTLGSISRRKKLALEKLKDTGVEIRYFKSFEELNNQSA